MSKVAQTRYSEQGRPIQAILSDMIADGELSTFCLQGAKQDLELYS
jgi:hypothetical protein